MKEMKRSDFIWDEFVYGGHWLSIGAGAIVFSAMIIFNFMIRWEFILLIYLIVQCSYNYNHYKELQSDMLSDSPRAHHLKKYVTAMPYIIFLYGLCYVVILLLCGNVSSILYGLLLLVISIFFTYKGKKIFSRLIGFKSYYAALTWAAIIPFTAIYISYPINLTVFLFSSFVFIRLLVSINFFDIKDIASDSKDEIQTLVLGLGKEKFISLLHILNLISMLPIIIGTLFNIFPIYTFSLVLLFFYSYIYIIKGRAKKEEIQNISYVLVDGEFYFWPILIFIMLILGLV
ncbi:MAG: UbiA family prenyltransferase [Candidatus Thermoplasmatota archaeon]